MKTASLTLSPGAPASLPAATAALRRPAALESSPACAVGSVKVLWLLARKEFADRFRSGWVLACILVWLGAIGLTSFFGLLQIGRIGMLGYDRTVITMLNLVQYLVPLLGLLLGHDLIASEKEERTLRLLLASGLSRSRVLLGKFLGGCLTVSLPLVAGFAIAGTVIGIAAKDTALAPFLKLAATGLLLGIVFVAIGLVVSCFSKTRVQAIVAALLAWCAFIFVFDLIALGVIVSTKSPAATHEIEVVCDAMHVNAAADIHSESADVGATLAPLASASEPRNSPDGSVRLAPLLCIAFNPVDVFRAMNLGGSFATGSPLPIGLGSFCAWIIASLLLARWKLGRIDL